MTSYFVQVIVIPALITFGYFYGGLIFEEIKPSPINENIIHTKLTTPGPILSQEGIPQEFGYMTAPLKSLNLNDLSPWQKFRVKKWDHFDVITDKMVVTIAIADVFYLGEINVHFFDYTTREYKHIKRTLLPYMIPNLSATSYRFTDATDDIIYQGQGIVLKAENLGHKVSNDYQTKRVFFSCDELGFKLEFNMNSLLGQDYIVGITPLTKEKEQFLYTVRMPNIITEGTLKVGLKEYSIRNDNAGAYFDFTRGIWTYNTYWTFARGQGFLEDGEMFSINLPGGYGDKETSQATEDVFYLGKTMYKLDLVQPNFDDNNLMNPFTFKTRAGSAKEGVGECDIVFAPNYKTEQSLNLFVLKSELRQVYGQFSGWVSDGKTKYEFANINGFVEVYKGKW